MCSHLVRAPHRSAVYILPWLLCQFGLVSLTGAEDTVPLSSHTGTIAVGSVHGIYVMDPRGSACRRATSGDDSDPALSPNGNWIAFTRHVEDRSFLHVVRPDGSGLRRVGSTSGEDGFGPSWSADGSTLVFWSCLPSEDLYAPTKDHWLDPSPDAVRLMVHRVALDGAHETIRCLASLPPCLPDWSPDGAAIVFSRAKNWANDSGAEIWLLEVEGGKVQALTDNSDTGVDGQPLFTGAPPPGSVPPPFPPESVRTDTQPAFSSDGEQIAFLRNGDIHTMRRDGTRVQRLTWASARIGAIAWSPDGREIAFARSDTEECEGGGGTFDEAVWAVSVNDCKLRRVRSFDCILSGISWR